MTRSKPLKNILVGLGVICYLTVTVVCWKYVVRRYFGFKKEVESHYVTPESFLETSVKVKEMQLGAEHPDFGIYINNIAEGYRKAGMYDKAEPLYIRALSIFEKSFGPDSEEVGLIAKNIGNLYYAKHDFLRGKSFFERNLKILENNSDVGWMDIVFALNNVAVGSAAAEDYAKAEQCLRRAITIAEENVGQDHAMVKNMKEDLIVIEKKSVDVE
ncbi:MAG: tetratricopeptide repeat protein [Clostridiaceae bacterium]|nr:tetratricopeptide repeat protein [Clostridiaceae bacterium]